MSFFRALRIAFLVTVVAAFAVWAGKLSVLGTDRFSEGALLACSVLLLLCIGCELGEALAEERSGERADGERTP